MKPISRRTAIVTGLAAAAAGASGLVLGPGLARRHGLIPPDSRIYCGAGETINYAAQRLLASGALAREFTRSMISAVPFANPAIPPDRFLKASTIGSLADWRLTIDGLVARPLSLSIADLHRMPVRSQVTEVVCEEGWSYIAEWIGTPLSEVLLEAGLLPQARYVVYRSIDTDWWDSLDTTEARHPQTLLTYAMNNGDLPVPFGGPLRLRVPRQLGYKSIKYIVRMTAVDSLKNIGNGMGSGNPDYDYTWFAGI